VLHTKLIKPLSFSFVLLHAALTFAAADWPMFRGNPTLSGISDAKIPDKPKLNWSFKTGSAIKSSPVIVGQQVFFGSDDGNVYALDLVTGKKLWEFKTEAPVESTPCVAGKLLFVGSNDTKLYALNIADGKVVWIYQTEGEVKASPNYVKGTLNDGPENGGRVIVGSYDNRLHCVDAQTGKPVWTLQTDNYVNGAAAVADNKTVFGGCDALLHVIDTVTGKEIAKVEAGGYIAASAALVDGVAYVGHYEHEFLAIDIKKAAVKWRFKNPKEFAFFASPAVTKDKVIFGGRDKIVHCRAREDGKEIWKFAAKGKVDSSPVVAGDKVIVGCDDGCVYMINLSDGKEL